MKICEVVKTINFKFSKEEAKKLLTIVGDKRVRDTYGFEFCEEISKIEKDFKKRYNKLMSLF